jgi:cell division protein FtsB
MLVLVAVFGTASWEGYLLRREAAALAREYEELRRQNATLREEIRLLHTPEYIERLAREQLGLVRPDEIAVILVQPLPAPAPPSARDASAETAGTRDALPWWWRLWRR